MKPTVTIKLDKPVSAGFSGTSRVSEFVFKPDSPIPYFHPGVGGDIRWGCWTANFWFWCKAGRTTTEALAIAKRKLAHYARRWDDMATIESHVQYTCGDCGQFDLDQIGYTGCCPIHGCIRADRPVLDCPEMDV